MNAVFYYVRHGQTVFNAQRRLQGQCDSPLTEKGIADAYKAEKALRMIPFEKAYCSSSERCIDTANIILERHNVKAKPMKVLKEVDFGSMDGCLLEEIREEFEERKKTDHFEDLGGDSRESLRKRITETFNQIADQACDNDRILVVSHGSFGMHVLQFLFSMDTAEFIARRKKEDPNQFAFPNCGIMKFQRNNGQWQMKELPVEPDRFLDNDTVIAMQ